MTATPVGPFDRNFQQIYHPRPMGQRAAQQIVAIFLAALPGCRDRQTPRPAAASTPAPGIVSLVPAATGLLLGMNAGRHLLAVSNVDHDARIASLPRVGDYLTTDWEQISQLHPQVIITQYGEGKTPEGFRQRAAALGIRQVNLQIERLDDVFAAITTLGEVAQEPDAARAAAMRFRARLDAVRRRVADHPRVSALIVTDDSGLAVAGPGTFLDDLLTLAGGRNAAGSLAQKYATIDRETLISLAPQTVFQLLPGVTPQVAAQARAAWNSVPELPAVKNHRLILLDDWYVELPSYELADLAESFAAALHPEAATQAVGTNASHSTGFQPVSGAHVDVRLSLSSETSITSMAQQRMVAHEPAISLPRYSGGGLGRGGMASSWPRRSKDQSFFSASVGGLPIWRANAINLRLWSRRPGMAGQYNYCPAPSPALPRSTGGGRRPAKVSRTLRSHRPDTNSARVENPCYGKPASSLPFHGRIS